MPTCASSWGRKAELGPDPLGPVWLRTLSKKGSTSHKELSPAPCPACPQPFRVVQDIGAPQQAHLVGRGWGGGEPGEREERGGWTLASSP